MTASQVVTRLAGVSGALAVAAGAYGAHGFRRSDREDYLKELYETGKQVSFLPQPGARRCSPLPKACTGWHHTTGWHGVLLRILVPSSDYW
ncbi:hypothetical protein AALO_G00302270 [Alosa alosa]|uniref:Uncharacterized protein n=1 Tax=Alosa alosa TaxID=278164 RepID=A0AAV6FJ10_9TELE|nr:hypothetical protein AALO_G00302270 [Alosa alosa]